MTTNAFVGGVSLFRGDGGSPQEFEEVCQLFGISGLGESNALIDATTFCSRGNAEYIGGLADGSEVTLELNFETIGAGKALIQQMIQSVKQRRTDSYQLRAYGDPDNPDTVQMIFHLDALALSWTLNPSPTAKNSISFGVKISGAIDITDETNPSE
jgi:hypothetical protein